MPEPRAGLRAREGQGVCSHRSVPGVGSELERVSRVSCQGAYNKVTDHERGKECIHTEKQQDIGF